MENKEFTTIQIYREDLNFLNSLCKKTENLRDKLHEVLKKVRSEEEIPHPASYLNNYNKEVNTKCQH
jgi:hypothetical protein